MQKARIALISWTGLCYVQTSPWGLNAEYHRFLGEAEEESQTWQVFQTCQVYPCIPQIRCPHSPSPTKRTASVPHQSTGSW